jgi:hypothetical protein
MRVLYYSKNLVIGDGKDVSAEERARRTILRMLIDTNAMMLASL